MDVYACAWCKSWCISPPLEHLPTSVWVKITYYHLTQCRCDCPHKQVIQFITVDHARMSDLVRRLVK